VSDDIGLSDCKVCFGRKRILVGMSLLPPSMPAQTATCRWWSQPTADRAASRAAPSGSAPPPSPASYQERKVQTQEPIPLISRDKSA